VKVSLYRNLGLEGGPNFRWQYNQSKDLNPVQVDLFV